MRSDECVDQPASGCGTAPRAGARPHTRNARPRRTRPRRNASGCMRHQTAAIVRGATTPGSRSASIVSRRAARRRRAAAAPPRRGRRRRVPARAVAVSASSTKRGSTPCARSCSSTCSRVGACAISGSRAELLAVDESAAASSSGAPACSRTTNGSAQSGAASSGPFGSGVSASARSSSPRTSAASSARVSTTSRAARPARRRRAGTTERGARAVGRRADAQRGGALAVERGEVGLRGAHARDQRVGVREQDLAGGRQRQRARAARALDQPLADQPLERGDLVADRRLDITEPRRGAPERAFARDRVERHEVPHLDPGPPFAAMPDVTTSHEDRLPRCRCVTAA